MIELTEELSQCVRRELKINDQTKKSFTEKELSSVSFASISKKDLESIKYFTNLSVLELTSYPSLTAADISYVGSIIPSIISLKIKEQNSIYNLDLSSYKNLKELAVIHNDNLVDIVGIENVIRFTFYDNKEYKNIQQIVDYILTHFDAKITLDFLYYIGIKRYGSVDVKDITWVESFGLRNYHVHEYDDAEIALVMNSVSDVVSKYIYYNDDSFTKFAILYNWMIKNIKFVNEDDVNYDVNYKLDSTYHALTFKEGGRTSYSRVLQFLLLYAGIDATTVHSYGLFDTVGYYNGERAFSLMGTSDYSLLRVCINSKYYYCDIAWDSLINDYKYAEALRVFLLSKDELSSKHKFVGEGNIVNSYSYHGDDSEDLILNTLNRITEVDDLYGEIENIDNQIMTYRVSKETRKVILDNKEKKDSFRYPGEDKVIQYFIKNEDDTLNKLLVLKEQTIIKKAKELKEKYIPNNLKEKKEIRDYLIDKKNNYCISEKMFNILINL